jgi:outer membrane protein assembly factor BamD
LIKCGQKLPDDISGDVPSEEILELGNDAFQKGYFNRAGDFYLEVNRYYPYSSLDSLALFKAVDAFFRAKKYEKARLAADKFLIAYAKSPMAEQVLYLKASTFCNEIISFDRDQSAAKNCLMTFDRFRSQYPSSKKTKDVEKKMQEAKEFLVGQQLSVGKYYLKKKNPSAAIRRLKEVKTIRKNSKFVPEASFRLIEAYLMIGFIDDAIKEGEKMKKAFPDSSWTSEGLKLLGKFRVS